VKRILMLLMVSALMVALLAASALSAAAKPYSDEPPLNCIQAPCEEEPVPPVYGEYA
jgi:hypothetical protein